MNTVTPSAQSNQNISLSSLLNAEIINQCFSLSKTLETAFVHMLLTYTDTDTNTPIHELRQYYSAQQKSLVNNIWV